MGTVVGERRRTARILVSAALFAAAIALVGHDLGSVGLTWDEPVYMQDAVRIQGWTHRLVSGPDRSAVLSDSSIRDTFDWMHYWNPHPPVFREAMAAADAIVSPWIPRYTSFRTASLFWFACLVALVTWMTADYLGPAAAVGSGLTLLLMPRLVGHAHIAATDLPLTFFWVLGTLGLADFVERGRRGWGVVGAIGFGLAMGSKITGYLLPVPLLALVALRRARWKRLPGLALLFLVGALVAWLLNPLAWRHPLGYTLGLVQQSLARRTETPITTYFGGTRWGYVLPWYEAVVMTLITVPVAFLALAGWGSVGALWPRRRGERAPSAPSVERSDQDVSAPYRRGIGTAHDSPGRMGRARRGWVVLCLLEVGFFWLLLASPSSPNHDGVRLFLPLFPFISVLAGIGFSFGVERLQSMNPSGSPVVGALLLGSIVFLPAFLQLEAVRPYYLSYYGEAIGGARGADRRGMEATYWFDAATPDFLRALDTKLPEGARVAVVPANDHFQILQGLGLLRRDIRITMHLPAPYVLLYARKAMFTNADWKLYRHIEPVLAVRYDGVELVGLYPWSRSDADRLKHSKGGTPP